MRLIFAGSGEFGLPSLKSLQQSGHEVVLVVSQPDRPAGRGRQLTPTPIAAEALQQNLPLLRTADINREKLPTADVMLVIAFGQKIGPHQVDHPRLGSINLHGSRLPKYRGAAPVHAAILNGDPISGNSIIRLAERMDAGAVLGQSSLPIGELETTSELHDRLAADGPALVRQVLDEMSAGVAKEIAQDESAVSIARKLSRDSARIDWQRKADEISRQIRGLYAWPGCQVEALDAAGQKKWQATLVRARPIAGEGSPGTIIGPDAIAAGTGALQIIEIQPAGKRPMPLGAFRNGNAWETGMTFVSK